MRPSYADQRDIFNPKTFNWNVHLIGLGGIGSALALPLVKVGLQTTLHLWDMDRQIEPHNVPAQLLYPACKIGPNAKAPTLAEQLQPYCDPGLKLVPHVERVTADTPLDGIVISGVDSMDARREIWKAVGDNAVFYADGRIGGENCTALFVDFLARHAPDDPDLVERQVKYYEDGWLFPDSKGAQLPCTARTVIHPPLLLSGLIIHQLTRFARGLPVLNHATMDAGSTFRSHTVKPNTSKSNQKGTTS